MRFLYQAAALAPLLLTATAEKLVIPAVQSVVTSALSSASAYSAYSGPAANATSNAPRPTAITPPPNGASTPYWYEEIDHQGISAFGPSGYVVYRNVKDYGAMGDGSTDDTAAINAAITDGARCGEGCASTSTTPAIVYFPSGTYSISSSIVDYYYTQLVGNANDPPTLKATAGFAGFGLIDGDPYYTQDLNWGSTNVFFRQVRNFILDTTSIPAGSAATGIHWPTSQATSLQNIVFNMPTDAGVQHVGLFCESGSAGFLTDLTFNGGLTGASVGNQQFSMRGLTFNNCVTAIIQLWSWGWLYQGLSINNCATGIDMSAGGNSDQNVGSLTIIDSTFSGVNTAIVTAYSSSGSPETAGSLILENIVLDTVGTAIQGPSGVVLAGGSSTIGAWGQGHEYTANGPTQFEDSFTGNVRPAALLDGSNYYTRSKPQYEDLASTDFVSVRASGAKGDGSTDDTAAIQSAITSATSAGKVVFFDAGTYIVTSTIKVPAGAKLVGEMISAVIMSSGAFFNDMSNPEPVIQVGSAGDAGQVEWSDMILSTQGKQAGAILVEWNLATTGTPSGMWDVHARVGGTVGSQQQVADCPTSNQDCIGAYMTMHVTPSASGLYMENVWLWTADHDIDSPSLAQISIYNGRGLFIESTAGTFWLIGTGVEHHTLYQYQFASTMNIFGGFIQTETPYYQPTPSAPFPFSVNTALNDPDFATSCAGKSGNCANAWGLRVVDSSDVLIYGAGHYSFFDSYSTTCSDLGGTENCQDSIVSIEGSSSDINIYTLNTVGSQSMIDVDGTSMANYADNVNVFPDTIAMFRSG